MKASALFVVTTLAAVPVFAAAPATNAPQQTNPQISETLRDISAKNIEATIRKLVSFGTRHTLSDAASDTRGIGAARKWIQSEFERYSSESGGRLQVTMDEFTEPRGERNPQPAQLVNVVATLPGSSLESRDRIYVVSGHYDSRVSEVMNATADAPGADDDASGVAAVMEMVSPSQLNPAVSQITSRWDRLISLLGLFISMGVCVFMVEINPIRVRKVSQG